MYYILILILALIKFVYSGPIERDFRIAEKEVAAVTAKTFNTENEHIFSDLELKNIELSPKLKILYARLDSIDPDTIKSGMTKFQELLTTSKSSEDFLNQLLLQLVITTTTAKSPGPFNNKQETEENSNINSNSNSYYMNSNNNNDIRIVKILLEDLIRYLEKHNPKILKWLLSTIYGDSHTVTNTQIQFVETFSKIDKELSKQSSEWNKYWTYWFHIIGDYIVNYG